MFSGTSGEKINNWVEWITAICLVLLGILWLTPIKDIVLDNVLPEDRNKTQFFISCMFVVLGIVISILHRVSKSTTRLTRKLDELKHNIDNNILHYGTNGIYKDVDNEIRERLSKGDNVEISVLAFTLFSIAPKFYEWKNDHHLKDLTFNLYHLDRDFILSSPFIDDSWALELQANLDKINTFKSRYSDFLRQNNVKIELISYAHLPAIHGFKLSKGSIYISCASWDDSHHIMSPHNAVYEKVETNDISKHAKHLRSVFNNWIWAAQTSKQSNTL